MLNNDYILRSILKKDISKNFVLSTFFRSLLITENFVGLCFKVYNGKDFTSFPITSEMVGFKLGEFALTRTKFEFKKKKKKKR
jgi:small subunit ribosomal protein S19